MLAINFTYNAIIYDFIHVQYPEQPETSPEPDKLRKSWKYMIDYLDYINSTPSNQCEKLESLNSTQILALKQSIFFRFEEVINKLLSNLSQSMPIEEFKNSLTEKIQDYGLDEGATAEFLKDLFGEWEEEEIAKYPRIELENEIINFFSENAPRKQTEEKLDELINSLKLRIYQIKNIIRQNFFYSSRNRQTYRSQKKVFIH